MDSESGATPAAREQQLPSWLGIEKAITGKKTKAADVIRRWPSLVNATLVAFIMTMPPLLILLGGQQPGGPVLWIKSTVAGLAARRGNLNF
ncbi:hypothetical protein ABZP36_021205 [Zizania latifolia]